MDEDYTYDENYGEAYLWKNNVVEQCYYENRPEENIFKTAKRALKIQRYNESETQ
jgi:hypothetical protein